MQSIIPVQSQGHSTAVQGFGSVSNKHLNDWILFHRQSETEHQALMVSMDPKMRDIKPLQDEKMRTDLATFDIYERTLEARMNAGTATWRRDPYREEFIHEDVYRLNIN